MVETAYIYRIWSAARAHPVGNPNPFDSAFLTLRQFGINMSNNAQEDTGVLGYRDQGATHVWAVAHALITAEGKAIGDSALGGGLPANLYFWVAERFDAEGNVSDELVQTNHGSSQSSIGSVWSTEACWAAINIERVEQVVPPLPS